jgi:hypothetical protein
MATPVVDEHTDGMLSQRRSETHVPLCVRRHVRNATKTHSSRIGAVCYRVVVGFCVHVTLTTFVFVCLCVHLHVY